MPLVLENEPSEMEEATRIALDPKTREPRRAGVLVALTGVGYPVASCVLHFAHADPYPILDKRALKSLGYSTKRTVYSEAFWQDYVAVCRALSAGTGSRCATSTAPCGPGRAPGPSRSIVEATPGAGLP